ncbi:MAG: sel1 repeat family protein [Firmicutes bacterium]|nr:sel1 repeat family protein [Bacillota bacterium]
MESPEIRLREYIKQKGNVAYADKSFLNALIYDIYPSNTKLRTTLRIAINEGNAAEKLAALLPLESSRQKISVNQIKAHLVDECGLEESRANAAIYTLGIGIGLPSELLEELTKMSELSKKSKMSKNSTVSIAPNAVTPPILSTAQPTITDNKSPNSSKGFFSKSLEKLTETAKNSKSAELLLNLTEQGLKKAHSYVEELAKNTRPQATEKQATTAPYVDVVIPPTTADESTKVEKEVISEKFSDKLSEKMQATKPKIKQIDKNNPKANHDYAVMHVQGKKVPKNLEVAARYFLKAAKLGDAESQFKIAVMYETGSGVNKNINEAIKWYRAAEKQGHPTAGGRIKGILAK